MRTELPINSENFVRIGQYSCTDGSEIWRAGVEVRGENLKIDPE